VEKSSCNLSRCNCRRSSLNACRPAVSPSYARSPRLARTGFFHAAGINGPLCPFHFDDRNARADRTFPPPGRFDPVRNAPHQEQRVQATTTPDTGRYSRPAVLLHWAMALVIANWVIRDAQKRGRPLCYDYGMFLFFAWPIVAPVYLFQTRGVRAFLTLLWFIAILLVAAIAMGMGSLAVDLLSQQ